MVPKAKLVASAVALSKVCNLTRYSPRYNPAYKQAVPTKETRPEPSRKRVPVNEQGINGLLRPIVTILSRSDRLAFDADRDAHSPTNTERCKALMRIALGHFVQQSGEYACA